MVTKFVNDVDKHETLKQAAIYCYDVKKNKIPNGYKLIKESKPSNTGFYACALKKGNEVIIAYRGTDKEWDGDWTKNNFKLAAKKMPEQRQEAHEFCKEVIKENPDSEYFVTGHSLGGALAQTEGALFNLPTATFNPAGVGSMLKRDSLKSYSDNIINYHTPNDFIKRWILFDDIGTNYVIDSDAHPMNIWGHHSAENMKPLRTAVPMMRPPHKSIQEHAEIAKDRVQSGINNVKSRFESAKSNIPQGFPVGFAASESGCPGTYYVNGYTRTDGTEVSGYQRSCGVHGNAGGIRKKRIDEMTPQELDDFLERFL